MYSVRVDIEKADVIIPVQNLKRRIIK